MTLRHGDGASAGRMTCFPVSLVAAPRRAAKACEELLTERLVWKLKTASRFILMTIMMLFLIPFLHKSAQDGVLEMLLY